MVFSDLTTPTPTSLTIAGQDGSSTYEIADSFVSSQAYTLTLGIAQVRRETGTAPLVANFYADASGSPGMLLATVSVAAANVPTTEANVTFTFPAGVTLQASATYWFALTSTANTQYGWVGNQAATYPEKYRINSGAWNGPTTPLSTLEIDGRAVPEPAAWTLWAVLAPGGWLWRRTARARQTAG